MQSSITFRFKPAPMTAPLPRPSSRLCLIRAAARSGESQPGRCLAAAVPREEGRELVSAIRCHCDTLHRALNIVRRPYHTLTYLCFPDGLVQPLYPSAPDVPRDHGQSLLAPAAARRSATPGRESPGFPSIPGSWGCPGWIWPPSAHDSHRRPPELSEICRDIHSGLASPVHPSNPCTASSSSPFASKMWSPGVCHYYTAALIRPALCSHTLPKQGQLTSQTSVKTVLCQACHSPQYRSLHRHRLVHFVAVQGTPPAPSKADELCGRGLHLQ